MSDVVVLKQKYERKASILPNNQSKQFEGMDFKAKMDFWNSQNNGGLIGQKKLGANI